LHLLENLHISTKVQISIQVIGKGMSARLLSSAYGRRYDIEYIVELGNTIIILSRVIVEGYCIDDNNYDHQNYDGKDRHISFNVRGRPETKPYQLKDGTNAAALTSNRVLVMATRLRINLICS